MSEALDALLFDVILRADEGTDHWNHARQWAIGRLGMAEESSAQADQTVRLRAALSLCPTDAITHKRSDRRSRVSKIERHLRIEHLVPEEYVPRLAKAVDEALSYWLTSREDVSVFKADLFSRDGPLCRACHLDLTLAPATLRSVTRQDPYKLTWANASRLCDATVDHRTPISRFGTNDLRQS